MAAPVKTPAERAGLDAAVVESCEYGVFTETLDGVITSWNHAAEVMFGYRADEVIGGPTAILLDPNSPDECVDLSPIRRGERVAHFETTRVRKDGWPLLVALTVSPLRDGDGRVVGAGTIARDIRDRKRVEEALRASEAALSEAARYSRSLFEASLDPLATVNPEGKLTDVNEAVAKATGVARADLIGSDFADYFTEPATAEAAYRQAFAEGSIRDYALTIRHVDGHLVDVLYNASVYRDAAGKATGVFAAARDVTALKHTKAELERSNVDLEQFAYAASHDLAEPLRAISGPISLVARRYQGQLDPDTDQFIAFAVDGCARMQKMIDGLLAYSRVGRLEGEVGSVDSTEVMQDVLDGLKATIEETEAKIEVGPLPVVQLEASQLTQVLQNLVSNAVKFVGAGVTPVISVCARRDGPVWRFEVTDNGIGIEPSQHDRVFGMFKRLHSRDQYPGTGIGLALAKRIVERHGGSIGLEAAPTGTGSRFWFTVPATGA